MQLTRLAGACALAAFATLASAQAPSLPPPESTDPVALELMRGFPPPPDKRVHVGNILKYPNARWAYHHMRELGPTAPVPRGAGPLRPLPEAPQDLDSLRIDAGPGAPATVADWQRATYTDGLVVLHRGRLVYERYHVGMTAAQPHALWSLSKSLAGLLATELIQQGVIDAQAPVSRYLPELRESAWGDATVQQTLDMTTGARYSENFADPSAAVFRYLGAAGLLPVPAAAAAAPRSVTAFLQTVPKDGEHGTGFAYKSVDTEVIGWLLQRVTGKSFATLLSERLWVPIGAQDDGYVWVDPTGSQVTSIGVNATLRDMARVGELLRNGGRAHGRQVLLPATVAELRKGADTEKFKAANMPMRAGYSYHNHWWVAHDAEGTFEAKGFNGQHMHINPAAELVIVKLSSHPVPNTAFTHTLDRRAFAAIAAALRQP